VGEVVVAKGQLGTVCAPRTPTTVVQGAAAAADTLGSVDTLLRTSGLLRAGGTGSGAWLSLPGRGPGGLVAKGRRQARRYRASASRK
jgi:hypothetical protein